MIADWLTGDGFSVVLVLATLGLARVLRDMRAIARWIGNVLSTSVRLVAKQARREASS